MKTILIILLIIATAAAMYILSREKEVAPEAATSMPAGQLAVRSKAIDMAVAAIRGKYRNQDIEFKDILEESHEGNTWEQKWHVVVVNPYGANYDMTGFAAVRYNGGDINDSKNWSVLETREDEYIPN